MFHEDIRSVHSFSLYINKYIIVLFSGNAEFSGKIYSDPEAKGGFYPKTREEERVRGIERESEKDRKGGEVSGLTKKRGGGGGGEGGGV